MEGVGDERGEFRDQVDAVARDVLDGGGVGRGILAVQVAHGDLQRVHHVVVDDGRQVVAEPDGKGAPFAHVGAEAGELFAGGQGAGEQQKGGFLVAEAVAVRACQIADVDAAVVEFALGVGFAAFGVLGVGDDIALARETHDDAGSRPSFRRPS